MDQPTHAKPDEFRRLVASVRPHVARAGVLISGQGLSQIVPMLASPLLTRLYSPDEYGALTMFGVLVLAGTQVATGRYHFATLLPESDSDALQLTHLSFRVLKWFSAGAQLLALGLWPVIDQLGPIANLGAWILAVPVCIFLSAAYEVLTYLNIRYDRTKTIAASSVQRSISGVMVQAALGLGHIGASGLIGGSVVSFVSGTRAISAPYRQQRRQHPPDARAMGALAKRYSNFPRIEMWGNLVVFATYSGIPVALGALYSSTTIGRYALAYRILALPATLITTSIAQVYYKEASKRTADSRAALKIFDLTAGAIFGVSLMPFVVLAISAPELFAVAFGERWREAGLLAVAMIPHVWVRIVTTPLFSAFSIYRRQGIASIIYGAVAIVTIASFVLGERLHWSAERLLTIHSIAAAIVYAAGAAGARRLVKSGVNGYAGSNES